MSFKIEKNRIKEDRSRSAVLWGRVLSCALIVYIAYGLAIYWFKASFIIYGSINHWSFSEFMINYEGGFVRRGLLGEITFQICKITGADARYFISVFSILIYSTLFYYFWNKFRIYHIRWWFLASPLLFGFLDSVVRKDFLMGWMYIWMCMLLKSNHSSIVKRCWAICIAIIGLLIHEAFIFWGVPMVILLLWDNRKKYISILAISILIVLFGILCHYRGNLIIVNGIIESWNNRLDLNPPLEVTVNAVGALLWNAGETFETHIKNNIGYKFHCMGLFIRPIVAFFAYYLIINFIKIFKGKNVKYEETDRTNIGAVYIFVSLCMIPMFTILSNDYARLYQYIGIASVGAFITLDSNRIAGVFPRRFLLFVERFNQKIDRLLPTSKGWYIFIFLLWGAAPGYYDANEALQLSVVGKLAVLLGSVVKLICFD